MADVREVRREYRVDLMIPLAPVPTGATGPGGAPIVPGYRELGDGSIAIPARISRTGILEYSYDEPEGVQREYRSPGEVFAPESLASFKGITVCELHPDQEVDPTTWKAVAIGHTSDDVHEDGIYVATEIIVKTAEAIAKAKAGDLLEVSAGYTCGIIEGAGVSPEGEPYDAEQVGIMANHVALGPVDWGRSGGEVRLYLDSKHGAARRVESKRKADQMDPEKLLAQYNETQTKLAEAQAKITELEAALAEAKKAGKPVTPAASADSEEEEQETEDGQPLTSTTDGKGAPRKRSTADEMFARIEKKTQLVAKVKSIAKLDSLDASNLKNREIILMGIKAVEPTFTGDGYKTDYLEGKLDMLHVQVARERAANTGLMSVITLQTPKAVGEQLHKDGTPAEDAQSAYDKRQAERWKTPQRK